MFGWNLTEKEKNLPWKFFEPLSSPTELDYAKTVSEIVVYLMVLFVYSSVAPIMSFISYFVFCLLSLTYRNQLVYIYAKTNDSGGQRWEVTVKIIFASMVVAQITIIGIMSLKKSALGALAMLPLLIGTILFAAYLNQKHYMIAKYLPSTMCKEADIENRTKLMDCSWMKNEYLQPVLKKKLDFPENFPATMRDVDNHTALLHSHHELAAQAGEEEEEEDSLVSSRSSQSGGGNLESNV